MVFYGVTLAILFSLLGYVNATLLRVSDFQYILDLYGKNAKVLSLQPPILLIDGFVRPKEIQYLLQSKSILSKLDRGRVAGNQNVAKRTSATHFLSSKEGQVRFVRRLRKRIVNLLKHIPFNESQYHRLTFDQQLESLQLQRYKVKQMYQPHYDYSSAIKEETMNYRSMTFLMYLTSVSSGGETIFPLVEEIGASDHEGQSVLYKSGLLNKTTCKDRLVCSPETFREYYSEFPHCCCSESLKIKPIAGRAILFFPRGVNGEGDKRTWHGGCPIINGTKFTAQQWIHSDEIVHKGGIETAENDVLGLIDSRNKGKFKKQKRKKKRQHAKKSKGNVNVQTKNDL